MQSVTTTRKLSGPLTQGLLSAQRLDIRMCARSWEPDLAQLFLEATSRNQMGRLVTNPNVCGAISQKSPESIAAYWRFTSGMEDEPRGCVEPFLPCDIPRCGQIWNACQIHALPQHDGPQALCARHRKQRLHQVCRVG